MEERKPYRMHSGLLAFLCFASAASVLANSGADWRVWTVVDTRHVLRSEPPGDGLAVRIAGARNEWVSFQILVRSDAPVRGIRIAPGALRGPADAVVPASQTRLYRQHQLHIEHETYRNETFKPDWYPDPLIPYREASGANPTLRAMPFDLPAGETHGFWVDIDVPTGVPAGQYRGTYRVTCESGEARDVPVALTVWDFSLPQTPSLVTAFGSPADRMRSYYRQRAEVSKETEPSDWEAVERQCAELLSEHRQDATPPAEMLRPVAQAEGSFRIPPEQVRALREFVDRYHVNALQIPHPSSVIKDPEAQGEKLRAWLAAFDMAARELDRPHVVFFIYLRDEPNTREDYEYVQKWGRAIRAAQSVAKIMVVEQTWTEPGKGGADSAWGDLYGAVDIWCPLFSLHRQDSAAQRQALGETIWTYTALCQGTPTPWWHIDYPLLNYRVPAWMAWRDGMKGLLYWGGLSYWRQTDDPWRHVPIYTGSGRPQQGEKGIAFNGEGSLVYPARAVGYEGIVPTIRLKALRDGIEDYEYLAILDRLGKAKEADKIVRRLTESWFQWDKDPGAYEKARAELAALIVAASRPGRPSRATGPLRVHPTNPRYFTDGSGQAIYLTGSHTWNNLVDMDKADPPTPFDFEAYLDFLDRYGHNFIRLWTWDSVIWDSRANGKLGKDFVHHVAPLPWARTGPDDALDGQPRFDLTKFDPAYFDRLRTRVRAAGDKGIYVSIMLFEGWGLSHANRRVAAADGWAYRSHPFHPDNNINGIQGDVNGDGNVLEVHSLASPAITALQEAYSRKVVDTVNDLDNVLCEVANEGGEKEWNWWVVKTVQEYERTKPKQHPVGITGHGGERTDSLLLSPADWISPGGQDGYRDPAPAWNEKKVSLLDTDHVWGVGGNHGWVWRSFLRGHNPIFMDPYDGSILGERFDPKFELLRRNMGYALRYARKMDLAAMTPRSELASTGFCLANPGREYLVYLPDGAAATVDLSGVSASLTVEWLDPRSGNTVRGESTSGGRQTLFKAPFDGDAVLYLRK